MAAPASSKSDGPLGDLPRSGAVLADFVAVKVVGRITRASVGPNLAVTIWALLRGFTDEKNRSGTGTFVIRNRTASGHHGQNIPFIFVPGRNASSNTGKRMRRPGGDMA